MRLHSLHLHTSAASFFSGTGKRTMGVGVEVPELGAEDPAPELAELLLLLVVWAGGGDDLAEQRAAVGDKGGWCAALGERAGSEIPTSQFKVKP